MNNKVIGIVLIVIGVALAIWGYNVFALLISFWGFFNKAILEVCQAENWDVPIIFESPVMSSILDKVQMISKMPVNIFIQGEKEELIRATDSLLFQWFGIN